MSTVASAIPGYRVTTTIDDHGQHHLATGERTADGAPVLLKGGVVNCDDTTMGNDLADEFELLERAGGQGAARPLDLVLLGPRTVLVMDDDGSRPLRWRLGSPTPLEQFFCIASGIARAVDALHRRGIAHLGLTPDAVLVADDGTARLINFEHASSVGRRDQSPVPLRGLTGDLRYLAPEQTGRMLVEVDHRADLYSVGVLLYELLTGVRPFDADEPLELVHAHLAVTPTPVTELRPDVPDGLALVIERLLAKSASQRYRSAAGLANDLDQLAHPDGHAFVLGSRDLGTGLQFSDRLFGRDDELGQLLDGFTRACDGVPTLVLVAGDSGSGKSRLVQGLGPLVNERGARWAEGKFEELRRDEPYLALTSVFGQLVEQALMESDERVEALRDHLNAALAGNGALLTRLVPSLTALLGDQPDVPDLPAGAADTRFRLTMLSFVEAWARADRPTVVFLDDLQWADAATLDLCRTLLGATEARILVIGAYRANEVGPGHLLDRLRDAPDYIDQTITIELGGLDLDAATELIAESLFPGGPPLGVDVGALAARVHSKSAGNAFFLRQLMSELVDTGALGCDADGLWRWDDAELEQWRPTDNVAELMSKRIRREIPGAADTLAWAACLGHEFDLEVIAEASGRPLQQVAADITTAAQEQFVRVRREQTRELFRFEHDRIQEAAYRSLDDDEQRARHLALGRVLRDGAGDDESVLTAATDQLDAAAELVTDPDERRELMELNHRAGRRALASSSPHIARTYFERAMTMRGVGPEVGWAGPAWDDDDGTMMALATDTAKALWLSGAFDELIALSDQMIARARRPLDVVAVYDLLIQHLTNSTRHSEAMEVGRRILGELGEPIPAEPSQARVVAAMVQMRLRLGRRGPDEVRALPAMTDELSRAKMLLLNSLMNPAYFADANAMAVMIFRMCELSLAHGNAPESAFAWNNYGFVLCHIRGRYDEGHRFGEMAMAMVDEPEARGIRSRVQFTFTSMIDHWQEPLRQTYPGYRRAFTSGIEQGDLTYAALSRQMEALALLAGGEPLAEVRAAIADALAWMVQQQQRQTEAMVALYLQVVDNLQELGHSTVELAGPVWSAAEREAELRAGNDLTALAARDVAELWLAVLAADHDRSRAVAERIRAGSSIDALQGTVWIPMYHFLAGLAAVAPGCPPERRRARRHLKKLTTWSRHAPQASDHRRLALEAAIAQRRGPVTTTIARYEEAASAAAASGASLGDLGLICELAAIACDDADLPTAADAWRRRAHGAYARWGATTKVPASPSDGEGDSGSIDMRALLHLAQAVGSELRLDDLVRRVLTIALEVGGARSGHLIVPTEGGLVVVASGQHGGEIRVLERTPLDEVESVSAAIVNYVARRREPLILESAATKGPFVLDPDVRARQVRSVLCAPLINQGQLVAVVYLENDLAEGAFKPERFSALALLSTSASAAMTNATLVTDLKDLNQAYERFVPADFLRLLDKPNIVDVALGDGVERNVTVLFADIRGFTTLSERLTPGETFDLVNDYLEVAVPTIEEHGGIVDKYIGDAIMCLFPDDPGAAVRASLHLLAALERFNEGRERRGAPRLETGVGLHTGDLMIGTVGTRARMDPTVIGDAVNLGSRVEGLTKVYGAQLLVTEATWEALDPLERPPARLVGRARAAGKSRPIGLYQVLTPGEVEARMTLDRFTAGCEAYFAADFTAAEQHLLDVQRRFPGDPATQLLLEQCRELMGREVPPGWDGVMTHVTK